MKAKYIYKNKRQKAFLGATIGAVANVVGGVISAKKQKKAEELAFKQQQEQQYRQDNMAQLNALTQMANNTSYIDDYKKRISFKCGGKKKALLGTEFKTEAKDVLGGLSTLATSILTKPSTPKMIQRGTRIQVPQEQKVLTNNTYQVDANGNPIINTNIDRMQMYKIGGRKRSKCK